MIVLSISFFLLHFPFKNFIKIFPTGLLFIINVHSNKNSQILTSKTLVCTWVTSRARRNYVWPSVTPSTQRSQKMENDETNKLYCVFSTCRLFLAVNSTRVHKRWIFVNELLCGRHDPRCLTTSRVWREK